MNAARSKIKARKLNMKKTADIVIAIGIFIAVVGFAIFAASAIASWGAFFLVFIQIRRIPIMEYFVNDEHWDIEGYYKNLEQLSKRLGTSYHFLKDNSLHDYRLVKIEVEELANLVIEVNLYLRNPYENIDYIIKWKNIQKFSFRYDCLQYKFANTDDFVTDDGYGSVAEDEITAYDDKYLQHELLFTSKMKLYLVGESVEVCQEQLLKYFQLLEKKLS